MIPSEILKAQNAYGVIQTEMSPEIMVIEFSHRYDRNNQQKNGWRGFMTLVCE